MIQTGVWSQILLLPLLDLHWMLECKTDDARHDAMWCIVATHNCNTFWAKATSRKNLEWFDRFQSGFSECTFCTPIKSNASPHLATGSGFVNGSAFWDVVLMYNSFIISSSLKHSYMEPRLIRKVLFMCFNFGEYPASTIWITAALSW